MSKRNFIKFVIIVVMILVVMPFILYASDLTTENIIGSWETSVYINEELLVTRVEMDKDGEVTIKLREFVEHLGYTTKWNDESDTITLICDEDSIEVVVGDNECIKNGEVIYLDKPVYIADDYSYFPQSFLFSALDINIISIDKAKVNNRINNVYLSTKNEELQIVFFDEPITMNLKDLDEKEKTIDLSFAVAIKKQQIEISTDYAAFIKSNESIIKDLVVELLSDWEYEALTHVDFRQEFSKIMTKEINKATNSEMVSFSYITELYTIIY